ncbi:zinc finger protein 91-like [Ptychodera flava]|uniref:zinc finger protein 91-like n=1 Tax=Ptychodera flava TaxID=63121 RepID=UPI00396A0F7F
MTTRQMKMDYSVENLSSSILKRMNEFRKKFLFTDVEFCEQGQRFACHQVVLACCSPLFTSVLASEASLDKIRECFAAMDANSVKDVLDFMYTGKVTIAMHNIEQLLKVSTVLKFEELATGCAQFKEKYDCTDGYFDKTISAVATSCVRNEVEDKETMQQYTGKAVNVPVDTRQGLKCGSNIDASKLLKYAHDEDRNITVGSDDADVFDSGSDGNDDDDDPYEEDTANEETDMSNVNTETDIREIKCKIENEDQTEGGVPELFTGSNHMVVCENKDGRNMADVEKPVKSATVNQPHLFETGISFGDMNISGSLIKDDLSLSGRTHTDICNNINNADAVAHKSKFQTDENKHVEEENSKVIKVREASLKCEFCEESFPRNHLLQKHRNQEHGDKIQGHSSSDCDEKHKYLCTECNCGFGSKDLLQDHLSVHCQSLQTKEHGTTYAIGSREISTEQSANTQREKDLHEGAVHNKDFEWQINQSEICKKSFNANLLLNTQHRDKIHEGKKVFSCKECDVTFYQYKSLEEHRKTHDQDLKYQCDKCKKWFGQKETYDGHMQNHKYEKSIECKICNKVFKMKNNYIQHMKMHNKKTPFKCHVCNVKFARYIDLSKHRETSHSTEKIYKCTECAESFDGTLSLRLHITKTHGAVEQCKLGNEVFPTKDELYQHRQKVHKLRNYPCADCKVAFDKKRNLLRHKKRMHSQESLSCKECGSVFENRELLKQHHRIHDKEALYSCDVCGKTFGRKESFDTHVRHHKYTRPYPCEECGKVFNRKDGLKNHLHTHSSIKPYSCPVCQKSFKSKNWAEKHQVVYHSGDTTLKPWSCSECDKTFTQKGNLLKHQRVHAKVKLYLCDICGKSFSEPNNLTIHKRVHTGERPYQCELCGKSYKSKTSLISHQFYIHSSEKPHLCQVCGKGFKTTAKVKRHLLVHDKYELKGRASNLCQIKMDYSVENQSSSILKRLNEFRKQSLFTDVQFCVQGRCFACHQAVLACCSPMFNSALTSDAQKDKIRECFGGMDANTMKDLLDFIYTGKVTISMHNVEQFLKVSSELKIEELATGCAQFQEKFYNASDCPDKALYTLRTSCRGNELASGPKMQHYTCTSEADYVDTKHVLKCGSNIDASNLLKYANDEDRNITVGSDDADVFDSGSDGNDDDDDPYEEDTANEENAMRNVHTEAGGREDEYKIEIEDQNETGVPGLFARSNHMVVCGNKGSSSIADVAKPVNSASVNQPHLFETGNSVADMNIPGSHIKDDSSLSGETHTDICSNINHADTVAHKTTFQTDQNEHVEEEKAKVIKGREVSFKCEFCGESFPRNHLLQKHRNQEHGDEIQGHSSSNCDEKHKYLCTECNFEFGSKGLLQDHLSVPCQGLQQAKEHGTTSSIGPQGISTEQSTNTWKGQILHQCDVCKKDFKLHSILKLHKEKVHGSTGGYLSCRVCKVRFSSRSLLRHHQVAKHTHSSGANKHCCPVCKETLFSKLQLRKHMKDKHPNQHQCEICKKSFYEKKLLKQHRYRIHERKVWNCGECSAAFDDYKSLKEHRETHDQDLKYQCEKCKKWFGRKDSYEGHMKRHRVWKSIECKICNKVFHLKSSYVEHVNMHERKMPFKCHVCNVKFAHYIDLLKHEETSHSTEKIYKCPECNESFDGTLSLRQHRSKIHGAVEQCKLCNEVFPTKDELHQHSQTVHKLKDHTCVDCKVSFDNKLKLFRHKKKMHSQESLSCKECGRVFENRELLKQHHNIHDKEAFYSCDMCGKTFGRKESLDGHVKRHKYEKPYPCEECGKVFNRKETLERHLRTHSSIKPYSCPVCHKCFKSKDWAEKHRVVYHSGDTTLKPWSCSECDKTFTQKSNFLKHQRVHAKVKLYLCDICGKSFSDSQYDDIHKRIHTGERPYQCELCGKSFKCTSSLKSHRLYIHSSEKPHHCHMCGKGFKTAAKVKRHLLVHTK